MQGAPCAGAPSGSRHYTMGTGEEVIPRPTTLPSAHTAMTEGYEAFDVLKRVWKKPSRRRRRARLPMPDVP